VPETLVYCPLCTSPKFKEILHKGKYGLTKCANCSLIFTNPRPTSDEVPDLYGKSYMANLESVRPILLRICENRLSFVEKFKNGGRLLDVGCGNGYFLEPAHRRGWEIFGTETSEYCVNYCKEEFGISIQSGEIFKANFPSDYFDIITIWHTLEHVRNPLDYLLEFNRILKNDGLLFILVPNVRFLLNHLKGWSWIAKSEIMEHLYFFSTDSLEYMLQKSHFKAIYKGIGNIESIRSCFREKVIKVFSVVGRIFYFLSGINVGDSIQVVAKKVDKRGRGPI
jgi:2-polyprenyl-3-methyl-5-hydroxy-6-metoxy-1,4-benzoquinol methylase